MWNSIRILFVPYVLLINISTKCNTAVVLHKLMWKELISASPDVLRAAVGGTRKKKKRRVSKRITKNN